jgi:Spy/CpxP family protein refolding chaperone
MKRILLATIMTALIGTLAFAQRGQRGGDPLSALKSALNLTDAQVTAITALQQTERTRLESIRTEVQQKRDALNTLLNAASPSAVDVGNAAIALHASEAKIKAEQDYFISQVKQQLTGEQQQKLDTLLAARGGRGLLPGMGGPGPNGPQGRGRRGQYEFPPHPTSTGAERLGTGFF